MMMPLHRYLAPVAGAVTRLCCYGNLKGFTGRRTGMKRTPQILMIPAIVFTIALLVAACGDSEQIISAGDGANSDTPVTTISDGSTPTTIPEPGSDPPKDQVIGDEEQFVGLDVESAGSLAASQDRPWRISREDDEFFLLTEDYLVGRVTFEVDDNVVSGATIEEALPDSDPGPPTPIIGAESADLLSAAIVRIITEDNGFGGGDPFQTVYVATLVSSDFSDIDPLALEQVAAALQDRMSIEFIADVEGKITDLFSLEGDPGATMAAVVSVDDVRIDGLTAEIDVAMWCGSLCGVWLTYEAELVDGAWQILGTTGPIAMA